ncbi:MAG: polyprenyl diphosphate synthase, partial [Candidatus Poseidoniales archaeon]|nr:polyprenyl diphosphate synthase [Candidatus Poseidoniales archaeon]
MGRARRETGRRLDSIAKWLLKFRIIAIPARIIAGSSLAWSLVSRTDRIRTNRLKERILDEELPKHISIIMDGNRRFAWNQQIETKIGHQRGKEKLKQVMDWVLDLNIPYLSVYALSTENIKERNQAELESLYELYCTGLNEMADDPKIHNMKVKVQALGRLEMLPENVRKAIQNIEEKTSEYSDFLFTVCLAYGGREEIVDAVRKVAEEH